MISFYPFFCLKAQEKIRLEITEDIALTFVKIPAGKIVIGADSTKGFFQKDELPAFQAIFSDDFYIGQTEVTQELWEHVMAYNPSVFKDAKRPVEMVSWNDCQAFIEKLNNTWQGKGKFKMPTEAQWEYAAKLGEPEFRDEQGKIINRELFKYAWYNSRSEGKSHPVGSKEADNIGLYDMQGNMWEWVLDWKGAYNSDTKTNPTGPKTGTHKVYRGGSWFNEPEALRPENRNAHPPDQVFTNAGLRLIYVLEDK